MYVSVWQALVPLQTQKTQLVVVAAQVLFHLQSG